MKKKGAIFILSAPSGTGKSTICNILKNKIPNLIFSVSHTSRQPREGEEEGIHYHFISDEEFRADIEKDKFLEWMEIYGNYYGTSIEHINKNQDAGINQILELDTQGVETLRSRNFEAVYIFILPPSLEDLEKRLLKRGTETKDAIRQRLEIGKKEIKKYPLYDYVVTNVEVEKTVNIIQSIMQAEEYKTKHYLA